MGDLDEGPIALFYPGKKGPVASFGPAETDALRDLISDYLALLEDGPGRGDPVLARLYPSASLEDEAVASSFRDLTLGDLDAAKRSNAHTALASLGEPGGWEGPVTSEQQDAWLALLADLRLVIGVEEGVTEEIMEMAVDPSNPAHRNLFVLHYLGALQEALIEAMEQAASRGAR